MENSRHLTCESHRTVEGDTPLMWHTPHGRTRKWNPLVRELWTKVLWCYTVVCLLKSRDAELTQYRIREGFGPSSKTWPTWAPHWLQLASIRLIPERKKQGKDFVSPHHAQFVQWNVKIYYLQTSNISGTLVSNNLDHSDVVGASPFGVAPTSSSFSA